MNDINPYFQRVNKVKKETSAQCVHKETQQLRRGLISTVESWMQSGTWKCHIKQEEEMKSFQTKVNHQEK